MIPTTSISRTIAGEPIAVAKTRSAELLSSSGPRGWLLTGHHPKPLPRRDWGSGTRGLAPRLRLPLREQFCSFLSGGANDIRMSGAERPLVNHLPDSRNVRSCVHGFHIGLRINAAS